MQNKPDKLNILNLDSPSEKNFNHNTPTLLRLVAITLIVAGHFDALKYGGGGAFLLMMIVGYNISTFKIPKIIRTSSIKTNLVMVLKVAIPTIFFTLLLHVYYGPFRLIDVLLVSNYFESHPNGFSYWFIEVYIQIIIILTLLLSIKKIRNSIDSYPRAASFIFVIISSLLMIVSDYVWDFSHLYRRLPWLMLWLVAFGFAARYSVTVIDKTLLTILFILVNTFWGVNYVLLIGGALLIWNPKIRLPEIVKRPIYFIAAGSLFIYITHFQFASIFRRVGIEDPFVQTFGAVILGAILFDIYNRLVNKRFINKI